MMRFDRELQHDIWEGAGNLRLWASQAAHIPVDFRFDVITHIVTSPGLPPARGRRETEGRIVAQNGEVLAEGIYELMTDQGTFRVENIMGTWHLLANP